MDSAPRNPGVGSLQEWEAAEALLLHPTAANIESVADMLQRWIGKARKAREDGRSIWVPKDRMARLNRLLDSALQLRLGAARASAAGQAGYSAAGFVAEHGKQNKIVAVV